MFYRFLDGIVSSPMWIGYNDKANGGSWSWVDGSSSIYTNWNTSYDGYEQTDCAILDSDNGKWKDVRCNEKHKFLCKKDGGSVEKTISRCML